MSVYISGISSISAIENFSKDLTVPEKQMLAGTYAYLTCKEPVYKEIINPMLLRRMSRVIKMGLASALLCLKDAGKEVPDGIITATGLGCVEDSDKFLTSLIENKETTLNPTPFIQSTHNTIGSQIALQLKCYGYNSTYAGRGACFEMALLDSLMLLSENEVENILIGGYDELTPNLTTILFRLGLFHGNNEQNSGFPGDGASFALLSKEPGKNDYAKVDGVCLLNQEKSFSEQITEFLANHHTSLSNIDTLLLGTNSPEVKTGNYAEITNHFKGKNVAWVKHLCGEYPTASSFALWFGANCIKNQYIPNSAIINKSDDALINHMLIINHTLGNQYSAILLSSC